MARQSKFAIDVRKFAEKAGVQADLVLRRVLMEMTSEIILMSPVDTGRFRGNWQLTLGSPATGTVAATDKSGGATKAKAASTAEIARFGVTAYFVNNLPYARPLEYGHSKQAPAGMVRLTIARWQTIVDKATKAQS